MILQPCHQDVSFLLRFIILLHIRVHATHNPACMPHHSESHSTSSWPSCTWSSPTLFPEIHPSHRFHTSNTLQPPCSSTTFFSLLASSSFFLLTAHLKSLEPSNFCWSHCHHCLLPLSRPLCHPCQSRRYVVIVIVHHHHRVSHHHCSWSQLSCHQSHHPHHLHCHHHSGSMIISTVLQQNNHTVKIEIRISSNIPLTRP